MKTLTKTKKTFMHKPKISRVYIKPNYRWTDGWLEQINEIGNKTKVSSIADNSMDDFCFYVDVSQAD
ncbi:MAG TPA: hypothetical protein VN698_08925 [Bacteroidia bacterium]|nr:hypothetical protein [Bacteroidia bacterium]